MALFKSRKAGDGPAVSAAQPESVEAMRKRARHRLIGAAVLVLAAVIGFPLLFDTQPRPVAVDIPIEIPDKTKVKPLPPPVAGRKPAASVAAPATATPAADGSTTKAAPSSVTAAASLDGKEELVTPNSEPKVAKVPASGSSDTIKKEAKPAPKVALAPPAKPDPAKAEDSAKARALLDGKTAAPAQPAAVGAADGSDRFIVQVGAFADVEKAREVRLKLEKAGLKTYTQVVETKDGKRIRVRVGPYLSKAEADKVAGKIKGLDLPAAILTL